MSSQIDLGGVGSSNVGLSSNLNIKEIIDRQVEKMSEPLSKMDKEIEQNNNKISAYREFKTKIEDLLSALRGLRNFPADDGTYSDIFDLKNVYLTTSGGFVPENCLYIEAEPYAEDTDFSVVITGIAKPMIIQSSAFNGKTTPIVTDTLSPGCFLTGSFSINDVEITLDSGDTLADVSNQINSYSGQTGVKAKIIQPYIGQYRMLLQAQQNGTNGAFTISDNNNILNGILSYDPVLNPNFMLQQANDSSFLYNGLQAVERSSNRIDDFIDGITLTLYQQTPENTYISVEIAPSYIDIANYVNNMLQKYNEIIRFFYRNCQQDEQGHYLKTARIQDGKELSVFIQTLRNSILYNDPSNTYYSLFDIGIHTYDEPENFETQEPKYTGLLSLDYSKFIDALTNDFDAVRRLFEFTVESIGDCILPTQNRGYGMPTTITSYNFQIDFTDDDAVMVTYVDQNQQYNTIPMIYQTYDTYSIFRGIEDSIFQGYTFIYNGNISQNIVVNIYQGFAELLYQKLDLLTNGEKMIDWLEESLQDLSQTYKQNKSSKEMDIKKKTEEMKNKFYIGEGHIAAINYQISLIEALSKEHK